MSNPKDLVGAKKAPLRFVPPALYIGAAEAMESGATRYGPMNWREQPVSAVTYAEAMLRHIFAWLDGQDYAEDSGIHHLRHVAAGDGILLDALANGTLIDDRFAKGPAAKMLAELDRSTKAPVPQVVEQSEIDAGVARWAAGFDARRLEGVALPWPDFNDVKAALDDRKITLGEACWLVGLDLDPIFNDWQGTISRTIVGEGQKPDIIAVPEEPRPILCNCGPVRARYGDHLITCPRFEDTALRDLEEPHRDIGGEG